MSLIRSILFFATLAVSLSGSLPGYADHFSDVLDRASAEDRRLLRSLTVTSPAMLSAIEAATRDEGLARSIEEILAVDSLMVGFREHDADGEAQIHRLLRAKLNAMPGVEILGELWDTVPVPVPLDRATDLPGRVETETALRVAGRDYPVFPLWPNGALANLCPEGGLQGPLVDVRDGGWEAIRGLDLDGALVLMDFRGGRNWDRLFALGAKAVVVVEDEFVSRENAERLFANTPVPMPRFYTDRRTGDHLRTLAAEGVQASLHGGLVIEDRPLRSLFAWLPPTDPVQITISEADLLNRVAAAFSVEPDALLQENNLTRRLLESGQVLDIPGRVETYTVPKADLLNRLSREFAVSVEALRAANALESDELLPGQTLVIPNLDRPVALFVRMDAVSVVPGLPHGANVAADLATGLGLLEHLSRQQGVQRRRPLLVGFLDGDSYGGRTSRLFAETTRTVRGDMKPPAQEGGTGFSDEELFETYQRLHAWLQGGQGEISERQMDWFVKSWLSPKLESQRVYLAERRVEHVLAERAATDPSVQERALRAQRSIEALRDGLVAVRGATLQNDELVGSEKARQFLDRIGEVFPEAGEAPVMNRASLSELFAAELAEETRVRGARENNAAVVTRILKALHGPEALKENLPAKPVLAWLLDLGDGSASIHFGGTTDYRSSATVDASAVSSFSQRFELVHAHASREVNWTAPFAFVGKEINVDFAVQNINRAPDYSDFWVESGVALLGVETVNENLPLLDTPRDVLAEFNTGNLATQARTAFLMVQTALEGARDGAYPGKLKSKVYGRLVGRTVQFNIRSGIDAQDPVPYTLVYYPAQQGAGIPATHNTATYRGLRIGTMVYSLLNGRYTVPLEVHTYKGPKTVFAYRTDYRSGLFDMVMEAGQLGTKTQNHKMELKTGQDTEKNLVMTKVYPLVLAPGVDPNTYAPSSTERDLPLLQDAVLNGAPRHYGFEVPRIHFGETEVESTIVYGEPGRRMRIVDRRGDAILSLLIGDLEDEGAKTLRGRGYRVGPDGQGRNLVLPMVPVRIARDMQALATRRLDTYGRFGIRDQALREAFALSGEKLAESEAALRTRDWQRAIGTAREAWGIQIKNFPGIRKLGLEAVFSVVILMALLAPAAAFLERLVLGGKHIIARLGGTVAFFILGTIFLKFFHPAFKIATSPFILVIAFTMILMASVVLSICYNRFEVLVRRARIEGGEAESEEISLASSLNTAFNLGVSNLKKRPTRTALTAFTVTVLTFSIVTFVSVKGRDTLFMRVLGLDRDVNGVLLDEAELIPPAYEGFLFRNDSWRDLEGAFMSAIETEFGTQYEIVRRGGYIETAGGNNAAREGVNQMPVRFGGKTSIITALCTFEPAETRFSQLHRAVSGEQWFRAADPEAGRAADRFHVILPDRVATELGITREMVLGADGARRPDAELPVVTLMNNEWRVIGILDSARADRIRDVNGKSLAMVDYLRSAITPSSGSGQIEAEGTLYHLPWDKLALLPVDANSDVKAKWSSAALKFPEGVDFAQFRDRLSKRMNRAIFAYHDGTVSLLSAKKEHSVGGLAKILVPVILCILIVSNTMMGTVEERMGEVQMLGAIGLSPGQISFLLLSEATVFSSLGIIFGTFTGLAFSKVVGFFPDTLGQLSFNFTSLASTGLAIGTGAIVLIATLIPAKRAAKMAAPSGMDRWVLPDPDDDGRIRFELPFTLTRGNAIGMAAFFRRFMLNHTDSSSEDFNCREVRLRVYDAETQTLQITARMWLAPYDLDVAQELDLRVHPTDTEGVFGVLIQLHRSSGSEDAWVRTNYGYLDLVRRQFLLWRNLSPAMRKRYITEGSALLTEPDVPLEPVRA